MVNNALIERKKCPFCSHRKYRLLFEKKLDSKEIVDFLNKHLSKSFPKNILNNEFFSVLECYNCSGIYQKKILNKKYTKLFYEKYVPQETSFKKKKINNIIFDKIYQHEIDYLNQIFDNKKKINVLEIGSGWGNWAKLAKKNNFDVTSVEIAKIRRKFLKKNKIKSYKSIDNIKKKFDLIYSDQTFEHLAEPYNFLKKLLKLLNYDGYIYLKVPPGIYIKKKLANNYKFNDDEIIPLEHINVFNRKVNKVISKRLKIKYFYPFFNSNIFSLNFYKRNLINFYEYYSSKTIIFKKN